MAIGDRCQSAKTYLEKNFENFDNVSVDDLIKHGIAALKASAQDTDLTEHNVTIGVLGKDYPFKQLSKQELRGLLHAGGDVEMI
jgi:20S proteasome subunit alpha 6